MYWQKVQFHFLDVVTIEKSLENNYLHRQIRMKCYRVVFISLYVSIKYTFGYIIEKIYMVKLRNLSEFLKYIFLNY